MEFKKGVFQASKVMENNCGLGKSRKSHGIPQVMEFFYRMRTILGV